MNYIFSDHAWSDYLHWQKTDRRILKRINSLIKEIAQCGTITQDFDKLQHSRGIGKFGLPDQIVRPPDIDLPGPVITPYFIPRINHHFD